MIQFRGVRVSADVREFVDWLEGEIDVRHPVEIHVTTKIYGFFDAPDKSDKDYAPYMVILKDKDIHAIIAHEFVHYEQWRDGRPRTERGVEQRAQALVRRWRSQV